VQSFSIIFDDRLLQGRSPQTLAKSETKILGKQSNHQINHQD
jgi:hypothetical protein